MVEWLTDGHQEKPASAWSEDCAGPLPEEEMQIVPVNDLEPHLGYFSAFRVKAITFLCNN